MLAPRTAVAPARSVGHGDPVREDHFAGRIAATYDDDTAERSTAEALGPICDVLAELAGDGRVLELAIGTGRVALPLAARGVPVAGIELSPDMVEQLRSKPDGDALEVVVGDMTTTRVEGTFAVVALVFNTIMNLTTQDEQVACFANAAAHLGPGGCFVVETMVPQLQRLPPGQTVRPFRVEPGRLGFDEYDVATQSLVSHHYRLGAGGAEAFSMPFRYVWPAELDLMARLAGLSLRHRWADWDRSPFTSESTSHVSVWERP